MAREVKADLHAVYVIEVPLALSLEAEIAEDINQGEKILARIIVGVPYKRSFGSCILGATASYVFHNSSSQVMFWREEAPAPTFLRD